MFFFFLTFFICQKCENKAIVTTGDPYTIQTITYLQPLTYRCTVQRLESCELRVTIQARHFTVGRRHFSQRFTNLSVDIGATSYATSYVLPLLKCYRNVCNQLAGTVSSDSKKLRRLSYLAHVGQQPNSNMFVVFVVCLSSLV